MSETQTAKHKLWGLATRRERWGLSWRGWLAAVLLVILIANVWARTVHSFLAPTRRVETRILVVEGWVPQFVIDAAVQEFQRGHYTQIYATGGPVIGTNGDTNDWNTFASVGADELIKSGAPRARVQMVPSHVKSRDRTYGSALALRRYFATNGLVVTRFNLLTHDAHARRSHLLFQDAFGASADVGVISIPDPDYDPARWWHYSEGVREILSESIAWLYAAFIFHPEPFVPPAPAPAGVSR